MAVGVSTSAVADKVILELEARIDRFNKDVQDAAKRFHQGTDDMERRGRRFETAMAATGSNAGSRFAKGLLLGFAGAFTVDAFVRLVANAVSRIADLGDVAQISGLTTDQVQELGYALMKTGTDAQAAGPGLQYFADQIANAARGQGQLYEWLKANNVAIRDQNGQIRPMAELLGVVANLIQNASTPQERLNLAMDAFGKQLGPAYVKAMADGADGLRRFGDEAHRSGKIIDEELIKKADAVKKKWAEIAFTFGNQVVVALDKVITKAEEMANKASVSQALKDGTYNATQLAYAIELARKKGSPVDPKWLSDLERLNELELERRRAGARSFPSANVSTLPPVTNTNRATLPPPTRPEKQDTFERQTDQIEKRIAVMNAETAALDLNTAGRERARIVAELETAAKQANEQAGKKNTEVTAEQRAEIERLAEAYGLAAQAAEQGRSPLREFARDAKRVDVALQEAVVGGLVGFEDAILSIVDGTKSAKEAFHDMANAIIADLIRIAIRQSITGPIASLLGGLFGGGGVGAPMNILPGRRSGGPVEAGQMYETHGLGNREFFVPDQSGSIVTKGQMGGGPRFTYAPVIDARGADEAAVARLERALEADRASFTTRAWGAYAQMESRRIGQ
jgi:hypothetical protein